jgi:hypothetical protein
MMEKRNVLEPKRTVCDFCSNMSVNIRSDGIAVCAHHVDADKELQKVASKLVTPEDKPE